MWILIGFFVVGLIILYKRSTEIVTVNPLQGRRRAPLPGDQSPAADAGDAAPAASFAGILGALKQAAEQAAEEAARQNSGGGAKLPVNKDRAAILRLIRNDRLIEAIQLYRRVHGVDLQTAKRAVDKMMSER